MRGFAQAVLMLLAAALLPAPAAAQKEVLPLSVASEVRFSGEADLTGTLLVEQGGHLILEKGARITASPEGEIVVLGKLTARGASDGPVVLRGAEKTPWKGVSCQSGSTVDLEGLDLSGTANGLTAAGGKLRLSGSLLERNGLALKLTQGASAAVTGTRFLSNEGGVMVEMKSTAEIARCIFQDGIGGIAVITGAVAKIQRNRFQSLQVGINVNQGFPGLVVENLFEKCSVGIRFYQTGTETVVAKNLFLDSIQTALELTFSSSPRVENNSFTRGKVGVLADQFSSPLLGRNTFSGYTQAVHLNKKSQAQLIENIFARNDVGLFLDFSSYPRIRANVFDGNGSHIRLGRFQSSDWERGEGSRGIMAENVRRQQGRNPLSPPGGDESFPAAVDAADNWWDKKTVQEMEEKGPDGDISTLYDGHDLPSVKYEGFGEKEYRLDHIVFVPWRKEKPPKAGIQGWTGRENELGLP